MNLFYGNMAINETTMNQNWNNMRNYLNLPSKEKLSNIDWLNLTSALAEIGLTLILICFICFVMWLIRAIGLYTMARNNNDDLAWTAFIPFACFFTTGRIVGDTSIYGIKISKTEWVLPLIMLSIAIVPMSIGFSLMIFALAYYGILYRLFEKQSKDNAVVLIVLSILMPILQPFFIFLLRNESIKEYKVKSEKNKK